jgi:hypothetical protein
MLLMILRGLSGIPEDWNIFNHLRTEFTMKHLKKIVLRYINNYYEKKF